MELISICIPAYCNPQGIRRALESISMQTYRNYEVVITDDTPDNSITDIVGEFIHIFTIRYFHNEIRLGSPENFNRAIDLSRGSYIKILCHDDWFTHENSLAEFVSMLDNRTDVDLAFCLSQDVNFFDRSVSVRPLPRGFLRRLQNDYRIIFPRNFIGSPSATIFRRKIGIRFDSRLKWVVDILFYADILKKNHSIAFFNKPLVNIGVENPLQMTSLVKNNKALELFEWFYAYRKIYSATTVRPVVLYIFFRLIKKYKIQSTSEIPDFDLLPIGMQRIIKFFIWILNSLSFSK